MRVGKNDPFIQMIIDHLKRAGIADPWQAEGSWEVEEPDQRAVKNDKKKEHNMSKKDSEEKSRQVVIDIERIGEKIQVPEAVSLDEAIEALEYQRDCEEQVKTFDSPIERAFILDAAYALHLALDELFGYVKQVNTGFFGTTPPHMVKVPVGINEVIEVPWGRMVLPGIDGCIETDSRKTSDGRYELKISGAVKQKHMGVINKIIELTKRKVRENSIYKGKAFRLRLSDDDGAPIAMPEPVFFDISEVNPDDLIFSSVVDAAIRTNIFTPIQHSEVCRQHGVPLKRGVLLTGPYGVGKTLCATVTAKHATENGWTFILCERAEEFDDILTLAMEYGPAVVFCEDIDRVLNGERSVDMDDILNTIDGITAKSGVEVMVVLTTNHVDKINQAMLRPGRLDAVIEVTPPDALAAERLVRLYARGLLKENEDLTAVGERLEGQIPAVIREVVERSKLDAINLSGGKSGALTSNALVQAANSMSLQLKLLEEVKIDTRTPIEKGLSVVAEAIRTRKGDPAIDVGIAAVGASLAESDDKVKTR